MSTREVSSIKPKIDGKAPTYEEVLNSSVLLLSMIVSLKKVSYHLNHSIDQTKEKGNS
jgi:hypothetical protein